MTETVSGINPEILKWARERSGYSLDDVAIRLKKNVDDIKSWEAGTSVPTYGQLEKLAYQLYKRPVAIFFFPSPPEEPDPKQSFRTLPEFEIDNLWPDTRYAIRQAEAMQLTLRELNDGLNPASQKIFQEFQAKIGANMPQLVTQIRNYLGIQLDEQKEWGDEDIALKNWRKAIEDKGIFVFKRSFKQKDISGFCFLENEFPIIYLNTSTSKTRQIFTLFHELSHILFHTNGITKRVDQYINYLTGDAKEIEIFCNRFAAEFLVPTEDFERWQNQESWNDEFIKKLADSYKVSREVILRKLLDKNLVDKAYYEAKVQQWFEAYEAYKQRLKESHSKKPGGKYYATQATYLGDKFLKLAFARYYQGRCTIEQLADHFNMKAKTVVKLEDYMLGRGLIT